MDNQTSVRVENLYKSYKSRGKRNGKIEVLHNISFEVQEGEKIGIIGRNGAGKSTLLNILAQYAKADSGNVVIEGKVNAILDIGTNLMQELTGKENVKQAGVLYGYNEDDIERILLEIEEFVDIGDYWDRPVRTYSSGMKARIAFAQIAFIQPEILIIDEVLGVGDYQFVEKSKHKMEELCSKGKILFIVSHELETIRSMTDRCIWLEQGKIMMNDTTDHVVAAYEEFINDFERKKLWEAEQKRIEGEKSRSAGKASYIESLCITDGMKAENLFQSGDDICVEVNIVLDSMDDQYDLKLCLEDGKGNIILENFYSEDSGGMLETNGRKVLSVSTVIENADFTENAYTISVLLTKNQKVIDSKERLFRIGDSKKEYYAFPLGYTTSIWDITFEEEHIKNEHIWSNSRSV